MKTKNTANKSNIRNTETWKGATAKGALVWGSVYSTATSGAAYLLAPVMTGAHPTFSDIFTDSLVIFPAAGAARGLIMWRARKDSNKPEEAFTGKSRKTTRLRKAA